MRRKKGARVGVLWGVTRGILRVAGYGIYEGDFLVENYAIGWIADNLRRVGALNPRILLDRGERVYGCECWWGSENKVKEIIEAFEGPILHFPPSEYRKYNGTNI